MDSDNFVISYMSSCVGGKLEFNDCSPLWQLGIIASLLGVIVFLAVVITRPSWKSTKS